MILLVLTFVLAIAGFSVAARRATPTRLQQIAGATIGGGIAGAVMAAVGVIAGGSVSDVMPYALIGLVWGAGIGVVGVLAFEIGRWLGS